MTNERVKLNEGLCLVLVHEANNVPSLNRFRALPDPYVNVFYLGSRNEVEKTHLLFIGAFQGSKSKRIGKGRPAIPNGTK